MNDVHNKNSVHEITFETTIKPLSPCFYCPKSGDAKRFGRLHKTRDSEQFGLERAQHFA